jgi:hypothetical protein
MFRFIRNQYNGILTLMEYVKKLLKMLLVTVHV